MTDKRAYFKLDVGYLSNPKISALLDEHPRAILLHLECIAYASQHLTDGLVPMRLAMRLACSEQCDLDLLVQCGLLTVVDSTNVAVHDYLEHQRSASEVKAAADKGKRAAEVRWSHAQSNASSMLRALPNPMPREREEREVTTSVDDRFAEFWTAYPSRGQHSNPKKPAKAKWDLLIRRGVDPELIITGAKRLAENRRGQDPKHTPQATTWLNQERWADEAEPIVKSPSSMSNEELWA